MSDKTTSDLRQELMEDNSIDTYLQGNAALFVNQDVVALLTELYEQKHLTKEQFEGFLLGNIIKYRVRAGHKDDAKKDIDKAMRYEQWLREFQEHGTITL